MLLLFPLSLFTCLCSLMMCTVFILGKSASWVTFLVTFNSLAPTWSWAESLKSSPVKPVAGPFLNKTRRKKYSWPFDAICISPAKGDIATNHPSSQSDFDNFLCSSLLVSSLPSTFNSCEVPPAIICKLIKQMCVICFLLLCKTQIEEALTA